MTTKLLNTNFQLIFLYTIFISALIFGSHALLLNNCYAKNPNSDGNNNQEPVNINQDYNKVKVFGEIKLLPNTEMKSAGSTDNNYKLIIILYTIALGIVGFFSGYNTIEIYKKKEQLDKEIFDITNKFHRLTTDHEDKIHDQMEIYHKIEIKLKDFTTDIECKINNIGESIEYQASGKISSIKNEIDQAINKIQLKQKEIEVYQNKFTSEYEKHIYSYSLYSLIPNYIMSKRNRIKIQSATMWFSQNGNLEDLEMLKERKSVLSKKDLEMHDLFDKYITVLSKSLSRI